MLHGCVIWLLAINDATWMEDTDPCVLLLDASYADLYILIGWYNTNRWYDDVLCDVTCYMDGLLKIHWWYVTWEECALLL